MGRARYCHFSAPPCRRRYAFGILGRDKKSPFLPRLFGVGLNLNRCLRRPRRRAGAGQRALLQRRARLCRRRGRRIAADPHAGRRGGPAILDRLGFLVSARRPRHHQLPRRLAIRAGAEDLPARIRRRRRQPRRPQAAGHRPRQRPRRRAPRSTRTRRSSSFDERALAGRLPKGERLYSMGNPLDLGFTIVEGTYNGPVERSYNERIHFSGAINPGMSGGPDRHRRRPRGRRQRRQATRWRAGELPRAGALRRSAARARAHARHAVGQGIRAEIGRQLAIWQAGLYKSVGDEGFRTDHDRPLPAPESAAPWFTCWARTNAGPGAAPARPGQHHQLQQRHATCSWRAI